MNLPLPISAPFSTAQKSTIRNLVRRAARAEILPRFRKLELGTISEKSGPSDLVTDADIGAEAVITRGLQIAFPNALVVGEEAVAKKPELLEKLGDAELSFLVDPVDGTWNFAKGMPLFGTIIAACRFGRPVYGMIYDPLGDDLIEADMDTPATHRFATGRTEPLRTAAPKSRANLVGYLPLNYLSPEAKTLVCAKIPDLGALSSLRCSAYEYRMLAQGAVDFVMGTHRTPWDHAAGVLLCQKAGGHVAMLGGRDYTAMEEGFLLCASSKAVWDDVARLFEALVPSRSEDAPEEKASDES